MRLIAENVKLLPNAHMKHYINMGCGYRRYCYNNGLSYWNDSYTAHCLSHDNPKPNARKVRQYMVHNKQDWQYEMSSRILQQAIRDLGKAFSAFFDKKRPDAKHPKFYAKKRAKQSFKTDRAKVVNGKLRLDKPSAYPKSKFYDIRMEGYRRINGKLVLVNVNQVGQQYVATLFYKTDENQVTVYTGKSTAVDVNVGHFNYAKAVKKSGHPIFAKINVLPKKVQKLYDKSAHYQQLLGRKRKANPKTYRQSKSYYKARIKMQNNYRHITNIQNDILHKFTKFLVTHYDNIVIEDLDVKHMQMTHVASKGMQRSMFGRFRRFLTYKCLWYGKTLILADRYYPSTQLCPLCGNRKTGDDKITLQGNKKHHTRHDQYICYNPKCNYKGDRDDTAVWNLLKLAK